MTRPLAGQRNLGTAAPASASFAASLSSGSVGATTFALCTFSGSFGAADATTDLACAGAGGALIFTAAACVPGIIKRSPTLRVAVGWRLLALAISFTGLW